MEGLAGNGVKKGACPLVLDCVSQLRYVLPGKIRWRLAQGEAMSFDLGWLCSLIDPIELENQMLNLAEVPDGDADQVQESARSKADSAFHSFNR